MKQTRLEYEVKRIFDTLYGQDFTIRQALDIYMTDPLCLHSDFKIGRQFIQRTILKLITSGDLIKLSSTGKRNKYRLTDQYLSGRPAYEIEQAVSAENERSIKPTINEILLERLHNQKLQLLSAIGESEEYEAVHKDLPEIRDQIQSLYDDSRDRCSMLIGKVKALETLISLKSR